MSDNLPNFTTLMSVGGAAGLEDPQYTFMTFPSADEAATAVAELTAWQGSDCELLGRPHEITFDENGGTVVTQLYNDDQFFFPELVTPEDSNVTNTTSLVPSPPPTTFRCPNCGNIYSSNCSLKIHIRACERPKKEEPPESRKCNICNKVLCSVTYLKRHMIRHTTRPETCKRCRLEFFDTAKFKAHLERHAQEDTLNAVSEQTGDHHVGKKVVKQYKCVVCLQNFTVIFDANNVQQRLICDTCCEKCSNAVNIKKSFVKGNPEFQCERCGRRFVLEGFLQRHISTCDGTIKRDRNKKK